jgi:hypothetical protein
MDVSTVITQLNDLPPTFTRPGVIYAQLIQSTATGLSIYTDATEEVEKESYTFADANYGWLDVWGLLFGITRNANEADYTYRNRIQKTLEAWVGTLPAIVDWGNFILDTTITVTENTPYFGYVISLPGSATIAQTNAFVSSLSRIRPAGVPFQIAQKSAGGFLETINYFGAPRVTGAYLNEASTYVPLAIGPVTINAVPLLPSLYLTDPLLNPSLVT